MNAIVKILPLILNSKLVKGKKRWASLAIAVISAYQLFSLDGLGAKWGVPSYDTFYQEPRDVLITRVEAASEAQEETANEFKTALEQFKSITNFPRSFVIPPSPFSVNTFANGNGSPDSLSTTKPEIVICPMEAEA